MLAQGPLQRHVAWVSLQPFEWIDLVAALGLPSFFAPIQQLHLFSASDQAVARAGELLELDAPRVIEERRSSRPLHDGFITLLELQESGEPGEDARARVGAFFAQERARDAEPLLRACYGERPEVDELLHDVDFPMFDNGTAQVGFGLMLEQSRRRRWLWSRVAFSHK